MFELVQMTAAYSNAVLLVVLSNVTDVAAKLDLPVIRPVQPAHVRRFVCDSRKDSIGGWLTLTNGYEFWYENGHVCAFESSHSYFGLQDPDEIPRFFGTSRMNESEAVEMARNCIRKLGYNPSWLKNEAPVVEWARTAKQDRPNVIPHCRVKWQRIASDGLASSTEVEINTDTRRVEKYSLIDRAYWKKPPDIPQPPIVPKPPPSPPPSGRHLTGVSAHQNAHALAEVCAKASEMAKQLRLPIRLPIRPHDVKESDSGFWQDDLRAQVILGGGWRFNYSHGHISSFHAPDSELHVGMHEVWTNMPPVDTHKLFGKVRYTKREVVEFATTEVRKLGYSDKVIYLDQPAVIYGGPEERNPNYTRFYVRWLAPGNKSIEEPNAQFTRVEVDGVTLELKSLWLRSTNLYQPSVVHLR